MLEKIFSSSTIPLLNKAMDVASDRDTVIADNIANVDTPNFKRRELIFEEKLKKVLDSQTNRGKLNISNPRHIQIGGVNSWQDLQPEIIQMNDESYRNDENNVDIDVEMAKRTKNELYYDTLAQSMTQELRLLRLAITGRS
ncbi:MAG: flagellar basal body rod protein FlgB [Syntrophomonas sp.]